MEIIGTVREKGSDGEATVIPDANVELIVGTDVLFDGDTGEIGQFKFERPDLNYPGAILICKVKKDGYRPKEQSVKLDQDTMQIDVELVRTGGNETTPHWGMWAVGALLLILLGIVCYQVIRGNGSVQHPEQWGWKSLGEPGFTKGTIRNVTMVLEKGIPYVAFLDGSQNEKGTVMQHTSGNWENIGNPGLSKDFIPNLSLAVYRERPWVAYRDKSSGLRASVMKYSGTQWVPIGLNSVSRGPVSEFVSLGVSKDAPIVGFWESRRPNRAFVRYWKGDKWETLGDTHIVEGAIQYFQMALDGSQPYVAYVVGERLDQATIVVRRFRNPNWELLGPQVPEVAPITLAKPEFDFTVEKGKAYLAFSDKKLNGKLTVVMVDDKGFHFLGPLGVGVSKGDITFPSVAVMKGIVYVAFKDKGIGNKSQVRKLEFGEKAWDSVGQPFSHSSSSGLDLSVDKKETVYVAFQDEGKEGKLTVMRLEKM